MSHSTPPRRLPVVRRFWKPVAATGAGGTALVLWFEEILVFAMEIVGVILLTILGGIILLFNHLVFKSRLPGREDLKNTTHKGEQL